MKSKRVTTKSPRATVKAGEVPQPSLPQIRGKGMNAGGSPNSMKKLFSQSKVSTAKYSKGGKVSKSKDC